MAYNFKCIENRRYQERNSPITNKLSNSEVQLMNHLRMLWEQHMFWTRMTIMSMVLDLPDVDIVTNRLLRNPTDFELALRNFYSAEISSEFSNLLKQHLVIAAELVKAAKAGDKNAADFAEKRWYANADEIADFLSRINPYWSKDDWKSMLYKHLAQTKSEAVAMLNKDYTESINLYDEIEKQGLEMADMMTVGIISQFPHKFEN